MPPLSQPNELYFLSGPDLETPHACPLSFNSWPRTNERKALTWMVQREEASIRTQKDGKSNSSREPKETGGILVDNLANSKISAVLGLVALSSYQHNIGACIPFASTNGLTSTRATLIVVPPGRAICWRQQFDKDIKPNRLIMLLMEDGESVVSHKSHSIADADIVLVESDILDLDSVRNVSKSRPSSRPVRKLPNPTQSRHGNIVPITSFDGPDKAAVEHLDGLVPQSFPPNPDFIDSPPDSDFPSAKSREQSQYSNVTASKGSQAIHPAKKKTRQVVEVYIDILPKDLRHVYKRYPDPDPAVAASWELGNPKSARSRKSREKKEPGCEPGRSARSRSKQADMSSISFKSQSKQKASLLFKSFHWDRIVIDDYVHLDDENRCFWANLAAQRWWLLLDRSDLDEAGSLEALAGFFGADLNAQDRNLLGDCSDIYLDETSCVEFLGEYARYINKCTENEV